MTKVEFIAVQSATVRMDNSSDVREKDIFANVLLPLDEIANAPIIRFIYTLAREIVKYESKTDKKIRLMKKRINELEKANESLEARVKELEERRTA